MFYTDVDLDLHKKNAVFSRLYRLENIYFEGVAQSSRIKNFFLKILQNLENFCAGASFLIKFQTASLQLYSKGIPAQMFPCEFNEVFKNTYFVKHLWAAATVYCHANINMEKSLLVPDLMLKNIRICWLPPTTNSSRNSYLF